MRHSLFITVAVAALGAGLTSAHAMPMTPAGAVAPPQAAEGVQYWGGWGPRYYYHPEPRFYEPPPYGARPRYVEPEERIPGHEAVTIMRSMGYRPTTAPSFGNGAWAIEGLDRDGLRVRVIIDAYSGRAIRVRQMDRGQRFATPPVWPDERPSFYPRDGRPVPPRESSIDPDWEQPAAPERPARPPRERTARAVPVPRPRPSIEAPAEPQPQVVPPADTLPPAAAVPALQPPAASLSPVQPNEGPAAPRTPRVVNPQSTPPLSVVPEQPTAALPTRPAEPEPPAVVQPTPPPVETPAPQAAPAAPEPQPAPSAALPATPAPVEPVTPPAPVVEPPTAAQAETPPAATPQPPQAAAPAEEGVMIDGRFLGPNGETLPGAPAAPPVRQVTP